MHAQNLLKEQENQSGLSETELTKIKGKGFIVLDYGEELCGGIRICQRVKSDIPHRNAKQVVAMQALAGNIGMNERTKELLNVGGSRGVSAFMSYYILHPLLMSGGRAETIDILLEYFGGMLNLGATTFWEEFKIEWAELACAVDVIPKDGEKDIHGVGENCYKGYRRSLCHGWSSGAVPFLLHDVLGIQIMEPGFKKVRVTPLLGKIGLDERKYSHPIRQYRSRCI